MEGKVHKKKEASVGSKGGSSAFAAQQFGRNGAFCEVCDVACSSKDAYDAHVRGTKHQKVTVGGFSSQNEPSVTLTVFALCTYVHT